MRLAALEHEFGKHKQPDIDLLLLIAIVMEDFIDIEVNGARDRLVMVEGPRCLIDGLGADRPADKLRRIDRDAEGFG